MDEWDEIMANYMDARKQMNDMRLSRGFYPIVALVPTVPNSSKRPNARQGNRKMVRTNRKQTERKFVRVRRQFPNKNTQAPGFKPYVGQRKGNSSSSNSKPYGRNVTSRGKAASRSMDNKPTYCARCGKEGHYAASCPIPGNPKKRQRSDEDAVMVVWEEEAINEVFLQGQDYHASDAVLDAGAQSFIVGLNTLNSYSDHLKDQGINWTPHMLSCARTFRFGNDQV